MGYGFDKKTVVLGVSGGIAAYKSVEILRLLKQANAEVRVMMTANAARFIGALTFEALSGRPVCQSLFTSGDEASIRHIEWAQAADAVVIAPATANLIGKLAGGIADDALSTFMLAVTAPVLICPAMNSTMYENPAVQANLARLAEFGYRIVPPDSGELACGTTGPGRLPDPAIIVAHLAGCLADQDLRGRRVLVTAGPTREVIDPVRYISNPSSGKMGYALAAAAQQRGAQVTLISGPSVLPDPVGVAVIRVESADQMAAAVFDCLEDSDIVVKAAAVSDYRPREPRPQKIKKGQPRMVLELEKTRDILMEIGRRKRGQFLVGFAAETQDLGKNAEKKLVAKNLDMIAANRVGQKGSGFADDANQLTLFYANGNKEVLPLMAKDALAHQLWDRILAQMAIAA